MSSAPRIFSRSSIRRADGSALRARNTRRLAGVLFSAWLAGCTTLPPGQLRGLTEATALPARVELAATPFHAQQRYLCGPAALATVLNTYGADVNPDALVEQVYIPDRHGSLPDEMAASARRHGMLVYPLQPSLADLVAELAAGHPVLVFQNLGLRWLPKWHFAVVIGYDLDDHSLVLRSGTTRRWHTPMATFLRTWARAAYWARVIVPPGTLPARAEPLRYLQAAHELEQTAGTATARPALEAAVAQWPDRQLAWLALGNNHYDRQQFSAAEQAFRQAIQLAPRDAAAWNNLAYTLLERACPQQALRAVRCALQLDPSAAFRDSARDIGARASGVDAAHCVSVDCRSGVPAGTL